MFGDVGESGRYHEQTRARLSELVDQSLAAGERPIVLWLGDNLGPRGPATKSLAHTRKLACTTVAEASARPAFADFANTITQAHARGAHSYAVLGERDWQCGSPELLFETSSPHATHPWVMPDHNYVVRVGSDGNAEVVSSCSKEHVCTLKPPSPMSAVELVMLDTAAWIARHPDGSPADLQADASNLQQAALLDAVAAQPSDVPRLLVTHHPIETAGPHGLGGWRADSAFLYHHPRLQQAVREGMFRGVISAHDRSLQVASDLADGVKRSSRVWLDAPVFQVVAGASSKPDGRAFAGRRRMRFFQGQSIEPELVSNRTGLAELWIGDKQITARLHAHGPRWQVGEVVVDVQAPAFADQTPSPGMEPCINCNAPTAAF